MEATRVIQMLTINEVADSLRVSRAKVENLIYSGRLRSVKIDRSRRVPQDALAEFQASLPASGLPSGTAA